MKWTLLVLGCCVCTAVAAPLTYHDQRQHGDYNIRGRLHNLVILIIPAPNLSFLDYMPFRHSQTRSFFRTQGYPHQLYEDPLLEEKSFQVDEERLVEEPIEISLEQGVKSFEDVDVPVEISLDQVKKAKSISTTLKKADKEGSLARFGAVKSVESPSISYRKVVVDQETKEVKAESRMGLTSTSMAEEVKGVLRLPSMSEDSAHLVSEVSEDKSVMLSPSTNGERVVSIPNEVKGVVGLSSKSAMSVDGDDALSEVVAKGKSVEFATVDRRVEVDSALTDSKAALNEKIKLLSAGIEICMPDQRRDDEGNCQTIKNTLRSGQYFGSGGHEGVNRVNPALSFGLSPADA